MVVSGRAYDLHAHTTASDGRLTPKELVALAADAGLAGVAITDHDTVAGIGEAMRAGEARGIDVVPGVEIGASGDGADIHVLGLWIDWTDAGLLERLALHRDVRRARNVAMMAALRGFGFDVALEEAEAVALELRGGDDRTVGRPHIAELLVRKGYARSTQEAFERWIGNDGPAYAAVERIAPEEAIRWIHEAGGVAVLAHPGLYADGDRWIERLSRCGLDGVEASHADHDERQACHYRELAARCGLIPTAGSDFHGFRGSLPFHAGLGSRFVGQAVVGELKARSTERRRLR